MLYHQFEKQDKLVYSKRARLSTKKVCYTSKRKINPTLDLSINLNVYQRLDLEQQRNKNCKQKSQCQLRTKEIENQWIFNQFFIPNCDQNYFNNTPMKELIQQTFKLTESNKKIIKFGYFKLLQQVLKKPKLFNITFYEEEKKKIYYNRIAIRSKFQILKNDELTKSTKYKEPHTFLHVGTSVWVFRPLCNHLHAGKILSSYKDFYFIKFNNLSLGSEKIPQFCVSELFMAAYNKYVNLNIYNQMYKTPRKTDQIDVQAFELYLYLLKLKQQLLAKLRDFNNLAEKKLKRNLLLTKNQLQQYGWVGSIIVLISIATKWISNNYKVTNSIQTDESHEKTQGLPKLELSETYTKSWLSENQEPNQNKQQNVSKNSQINVSKFNKTQTVQKVQMKCENKKQIKIQKGHFKDITQVIDLSLNILATIQAHGKQFQVEATPHFLKLKQKFNDEHPQKINQIYSRLFSLHQKLRSQ